MGDQVYYCCYYFTGETVRSNDLVENPERWMETVTKFVVGPTLFKLLCFEWNIASRGQIKEEKKGEKFRINVLM